MAPGTDALPLLEWHHCCHVPLALAAELELVDHDHVQPSGDTLLSAARSNSDQLAGLLSMDAWILGYKQRRRRLAGLPSKMSHLLAGSQPLQLCLVSMSLAAFV
jgi:hypothetical protein